MDKIFIDRLQVFGRHGVLPEENTLGQMFYISAELSVDLSPAGLEDDLEQTVNYAECCQIIKKICTENVFKLIETLAEKIACALLNFSVFIKEVKIRIDKPSAPVGLPLQSVGVEISRKWNTAFIALGSNLGNKKDYLDNAIKAINDDEFCRVTAVSDFIVTEPVGNVVQDDFLNGCIKIETVYTPHTLLKVLNKIEKNAGRVREIHWGPRTLDLDIIFYNDLVLNTENLTIPHVEMANRGFVLIPLAQLAPNYVHPVLNRTVRQLLESLQ